MKTFAVATLMVFLIFMVTTVLAEEAPPWHWDDEEQIETDEKDLVNPEWQSDIGW